MLAADVVAAEDVPPFANTAVDGYAVRAADVADAPVELAVVGEVAAGASTDRVVGPGEAIRIMTGAPMPAGADAVVMVEDSERLDGDRVRLSRAVAAGRVGARPPATTSSRATCCSRPAPSSARPSPACWPASTPATVTVHPPAHGRRAVDRRRAGRRRLAAAPGSDPREQQTMLAPLLAEAGCDVDRPRHRPRRRGRARSGCCATPPATCDAIVTSGGVSMGDYDVVKAVLGRIADMRWMQIAIKPAKPFAFGMLDGTPVFGLPGNPVSSLVSFELLARPALRRMMGHRRLARPSLVGGQPTPASRRQPDGKVHFVRVNGAFGDDGRYHVTPVGAQGSHQLAATALADALAIVPDGDGIPPGGDVAVLLMLVGCMRRGSQTISSTPSGASSATCGSRSPTAATSAARTACPRRA